MELAETSFVKKRCLNCGSRQSVKPVSEGESPGVEWLAKCRQCGKKEVPLV